MRLDELCTDSRMLGRAIEQADTRLRDLGVKFNQHVAKGHYGRARQARARILKHLDATAAWGPTRDRIADYVRDHGGNSWIGDDSDCSPPDPDVCSLDYTECDFEDCLTHHADDDEDKTDDENEDENCVDPYCAIHNDPNTADAAPGSQLDDDDADETDDEDTDENCVDPYCAIHGKESA